jgi:hypothetical protein
VIGKILAPVFDVAEDRWTLTLSAEIAKYFHAHIEVVNTAASAGGEPPHGGRESESLRSIGIAPTGVASTPATEPNSRLRDIFDEWLRQQGLQEQPQCLHRGLASASWFTLNRPSDSGLLRRAQLADLVCLTVSRGAEKGPLSPAIESIAFCSGRPILVLPATQDSDVKPLIGEPIVVGWSGSAEAVHALTFALPFLRVSTRIEVISIGEEAVNAMGAYEVAKYLAWHGIHARASGIALEDWTGADVVDIALERKARLLVMGAHRHYDKDFCRNATRHVLDQMPMPVIMAA